MISIDDLFMEWTFFREAVAAGAAEVLGGVRVMVATGVAVEDMAVLM